MVIKLTKASSLVSKFDIFIDYCLVNNFIMTEINIHQFFITKLIVASSCFTVPLVSHLNKHFYLGIFPRYFSILWAIIKDHLILSQKICYYFYCSQIFVMYDDASFIIMTFIIM